MTAAVEAAARAWFSRVQAQRRDAGRKRPDGSRADRHCGIGGGVMDKHSAEKAQMTGIERIAAERQRQIEAEGYTPEHDLEHTNSAFAYAAACYAVPGAIFRVEARDGEVAWWEPWPRGWKRRFQPHSNSTETRIRDLEKAGALIAAELDRILTSGTWNPTESGKGDVGYPPEKRQS